MSPKLLHSQKISHHNYELHDLVWPMEDRFYAAEVLNTFLKTPLGKFAVDNDITLTTEVKHGALDNTWSLYVKVIAMINNEQEELLEKFFFINKLSGTI